MTIPYRIVIGRSLSTKEKHKVRTLIDQTFKEIDLIYNKWNPHSEISAINRSPAYTFFILSPDLESFLEQTEHYVALSQGKFDPSIEPLQAVWKEHLDKHKEPSQEKITAVSKAVGWEKIHRLNGVLWKANSQSAIDLGGIAKGYAIDCLVERLNANGFSDVFVEWGGEIRTTGKHPENRSWKVMVSKWGQFDSEGEVIELSNQAVASSGDYLQTWNAEDKVFTHIYDPSSKRPLSISRHSICSVTVTAPSCTMADAFATAGMLFSTVEEASLWFESIKTEYPEIRYWIFTR